MLKYPEVTTGESLVSYLTRIAHQNLDAPLSNLLMRIGLKAEDLNNPEKLSGLIERLPDLRVRLQTLCLFTSMKNNHFQIFYGVEIPCFHFVRETRVCAKCLASQGFLSAKWQVGWLPFCTKHGAPLEILSDLEWLTLLERRNHLFLAKAVNDGDYQKSGIARLLMPISGNENRRINRFLSIQHSLERHLDFSLKQGNISALFRRIERIMVKSKGFKTTNELFTRKRRYPEVFFPFKDDDVLKFLECLDYQNAA